MKNKIILTTTLFLILVTMNLIAAIDPLINLNPLIPFSFTYEYRSPREWQVEIITGTSLDVAGLSNQATGTAITGQVGLKFGLPGDIVLLATYPWIGGYVCIDEGDFMPEFDLSINVPVTMGSNIGASAPAININTVFKKTLQPVRFSIGHNLLFSSAMEVNPQSDEDITVGEQYLGTGLEWQTNPYLKLFGEFRYQLSAIKYAEDGGFNFDWLIPASLAKNILSIGGEYTLNTQNFIMKTTAGYAINLLPFFDIEGGGTPFTSHSVSVGISFLFPFPLAPEYWENDYSPFGEVP
ncbi:MAG TPA: hypothetical protein P5107_05545 [Thermotogota bacterium]|nr:hypothetical protein [Thermotogota bacterium]